MEHRQLGRFGSARERALLRGDDLRRVEGVHEGRDLDGEEARHVFDRALDAGIDTVDTANVYSEGRWEELLGPGWRGSATG